MQAPAKAATNAGALVKKYNKDFLHKREDKVETVDKKIFESEVLELLYSIAPEHRGDFISYLRTLVASEGELPAAPAQHVPAET